MDVEAIVREYISKTPHLSFATCSRNKPWVCEVHFAYDDNLNLYFRSLRSRRHSLELEENPYIAGNIVKQHDLNEYPHALYFEGTAEHAGDEAVREQIYPYFKNCLGSPESILEEARHDDGHQFYKISVGTLVCIR